MISFVAELKKYGENGEKTGWTYIQITEAQAQLLMPDTRKSFRVKGALDNFQFNKLALIPIGEGNFILPVNQTIRRQLRKTTGATVQVKMEADKEPYQLCQELMQCLEDEPTAFEFFNTLTGSHQKYFSRWIESAKTEVTKAKRIAKTVTACSRKMGYSEMVKNLKDEVF